MFDIKQKCVIITGGAQGLGKRLTKKLIEKNCKVCFCDILEDKGNQTKYEIQNEFNVQDDRLCFIRCDVTSKHDWEKMWNFAERAFNNKIDILINNAAIGPSSCSTKCLEVIAIGTMNGISIALNRMGKSNGGNGGRIVNISSAAGVLHQNLRLSWLGYGSAKHAVINMTRSFTTIQPDIYDNEAIKCYALAPWAIKSDLLREFQVEAQDSGPFMEYEDMGTIGKLILDKTGLYDVLSINEVANSIEYLFERDINGSVYFIYPGAPMIQLSGNLENIFIFSTIFLSRILRFFGLKIKEFNCLNLVMVCLGFYLCIYLLFMNLK